MATSQNGYKANDRSLVATYTIPGSPVKITLRKGDVSVVLLDFAAWYNRNIEPLQQKDTGGYVERAIIGSTTLSNHASGTAEDLRWNDHPLGVHGTFTAEEKRKINERLAYYEGVIRWGENYNGRIDGMHYEINKGLADVKRVADKIRVDNTPPRKVEWMSLEVKLPVLKQGDRDDKLPGYDRIRRIQRIIGVKDDGWWGEKTTEEIADWCGIKPEEAKVLTEEIYRKLFALS
jgi:hypothetical protein